LVTVEGLPAAEPAWERDALVALRVDVDRSRFDADPRFEVERLRFDGDALRLEADPFRFEAFELDRLRLEADPLRFELGRLRVELVVFAWAMLTLLLVGFLPGRPIPGDGPINRIGSDAGCRSVRADGHLRISRIGRSTDLWGALRLVGS